MAESIRFTAPHRQLAEEDRIELTSVGVDIGSATSHLVFSRLELERAESRYEIVRRHVHFESNILLTPYLTGTTIDGESLGRFIAFQYDLAGLRREDVDTGALILTGVALQRENARAIADLFAEEAGRFVAVSAGDNLEAIMAAHGSGAVALSADGQRVILNVDIGGGTVKFAVCQGGIIKGTAALNVGSRLVILDDDQRIIGFEETGRRIVEQMGLNIKLGERVSTEQLEAIAAHMAEQILHVMRLKALPSSAQQLLRTPPLGYDGTIDGVVFSGGVSEFIYDRQALSFGDLGQFLAAEVRARLPELGAEILEPLAGIRATVIGASQYTVQVSGSTIFISSLDAVPIRNMPVVHPDIQFAEEIDPSAVQWAVERALHRFDLQNTETPVALILKWQGSATFQRLNSLCRGIVDALKLNLGYGNPIVLVSDGDIGGLLGLHMKDEVRVQNPIISIDGIRLSEFDFIDIGNFIPSSGAVPVIIKSLVFPS